MSNGAGEIGLSEQAPGLSTCSVLGRLPKLGVRINQHSAVPIPFSSITATSARDFLVALNAGASIYTKRLGYTLAEDIALGYCNWPHEEKYAILEYLASQGLALHPIHLAALKGDRKTLLAQVEQGNFCQEDSAGNTVICYLCGNGRWEMLWELQQLDASLFVKANQDGVTPILFAVEGGHLETVKWMLKEGGASVTGETGTTALLLAAFHGRLEVLKWLLTEGGVRISEQQPRFHTALLCAAQAAQTKTVLWLLSEGGASILEKDGQGVCALSWAAHNGHLATVQWLLREGGAKVTERCDLGETPLLYAACNGHLEVVKWLLKEGADVTERDNAGMTALLRAARHGHLSTVQWLIQEGGAKPSEKNAEGATPLVLATTKNHLEIVRYLLTEGGAKITESAESALAVAVMCGHLDIVKWLVREGGANIFEQNEKGKTLLICAASVGHLRIVQWLVKEAGAKVAEGDALGFTALGYAACYGWLGVVQWLMREGGATCTEQSNDGTTPLISAAGSGHLEVVKWLLIEGGAKVTETNSSGLTAMLFAAANGRQATVQWLLEDGGAKITEQTKQGNTALRLALLNGHAHVATTLIFGFGAATPRELQAMESIARGSCITMCHNAELLVPAVCIEYHLKQKLSLHRRVVDEMLQTIFPIVLRELVSEFAQRTDKEELDFHDTVLAKHSYLLAKNAKPRTYNLSSWQIWRDVIEALAKDISTRSSISTIRALVKENLDLSREIFPGSCLEEVFRDVLLETACFAPRTEIFPESAEPKPTGVSRLVQRAKKLSSQSKHFFGFTKTTKTCTM